MQCRININNILIMEHVSFKIFLKAISHSVKLFYTLVIDYKRMTSVNYMQR